MSVCMTSIDLSQSGLEEIPSQFFLCLNLKEMFFSKNEIKSLLS